MKTRISNTFDAFGATLAGFFDGVLPRGTRAARLGNRVLFLLLLHLIELGRVGTRRRRYRSWREGAFLTALLAVFFAVFLIAPQRRTTATAGHFTRMLGSVNRALLHRAPNFPLVAAARRTRVQRPFGTILNLSLLSFSYFIN